MVSPILGRTLFISDATSNFIPMADILLVYSAGIAILQLGWWVPNVLLAP